MHQRYVALREEMTVAEVVCQLRQHDISEQIVYLYVTDGFNRLTGVLPVRKLLGNSPETPISSLMLRNIVSVPCDFTMKQAGDVLTKHKLLAVPVVDKQGRLAGVADLNHFTEDSLSPDRKAQMDSLFQMMGLHLSLSRRASSWMMFRERFPWLLCNIVSGILCAIITSQYAFLIQEIVILAMFITVVLALGESVSMQSMTITIQRLQVGAFSWRMIFLPLRRELLAAGLLGAGCGTIVAAAVYVWKAQGLAAAAIGLSILLSILAAGLLGVMIPALIRAFRIDPKLAAGPIVLACADICTLLLYFNAINILAR